MRYRMGEIYGYARISTRQQTINRQITNIQKEYPDVIRIYTDEITGRKIERPGWNKLMKTVKSGDTIIFDEVSRMSRNAKEGFAVYKELYEKGINLVFLKESYVNTDSYKEALKGAINIDVNSGDQAADGLINDIMKAVNRFMFIKLEQDIYAAFADAQREVDYLSQRTKEGLREAKAKGNIPGRRAGNKITTKKSIEAKEKILKYSKYFYGSNSDEEVMKIIGLSRNTYYKYKKELIMDYILKSEDGKETMIETKQDTVKESNERLMKYRNIVAKEDKKSN